MCRIARPLDLSYVSKATRVVIGKVANYRIGHDAREIAKPQQQRDPDLDRVHVREYPIFDVRVEECLVGTAPDEFTTEYERWTFAPPSMIEDGRYLIATQAWNRKILVGTGLAVAESKTLCSPCTPPFLLRMGSVSAHSLLIMLGYPMPSVG